MSLTDRERLLARVWGDCQGRQFVVLRGDQEGVEVTLARLRFAQEWHPKARLRMAEAGKNTRDEAERTLRRLVGDATLVTSVAHQPRAFLTWLAASGGKCPLYNLSVPGTLYGFDEELEKIERYTKTGDCASIVEGLEYLDARDARWGL